MAKENYDNLLDEAMGLVPKTDERAERFEIPKVKGHIQGNKTIISNFTKIAEKLGRKPEVLLKYVLKELATPGIFKGNFVIIGSKVAASRINERVENFAKEFVICRECGKPDTKVKKEGSVSVLKCQVCGARYSIKTKA